MRLVPLALVALAVACASSGARQEPESPGRPITQTVRIQGVGTLGTSPSAATGWSGAVAYPIDRAWAVLPAVYDSLAIPITRRDAASRTVANDGFRTRQRLGRVALSRYLDCGNTQAGPSADSYEVFLTVATQLRPDDAGGTVATTTVTATAKSIQFAQNVAQCTTKEELERRVHERLIALSANPPHP
jgi:hypothetical protein